MLHYLFNGQYLVLKKNHLSIEKTPKQAIYSYIYGSFIFLCKVYTKMYSWYYTTQSQNDNITYYIQLTEKVWSDEFRKQFT